jgi:hypothetical protein
MYWFELKESVQKRVYTQTVSFHSIHLTKGVTSERLPNKALFTKAKG